VACPVVLALAVQPFRNEPPSGQSHSTHGPSLPGLIGVAERLTGATSGGGGRSRDQPPWAPRACRRRAPASGSPRQRCPDEAALRHWKTAAQRVLGGASLDAVGAALFEKGVRGPRGGKVGHAALRNFLTHPALVGRSEYADSPNADGERVRRTVKAKWEPMVDVALHEEVSKRLAGHTRAAEAELEKARDFARSKERAWERLEGIIHESRNLAAAWDSAGPEERRILLDYWVLDVLIVVEPIPGMRRANQKTALVRLRSAPNAPRHFESSTGRAQRPVAATASSAEPNSARTPSSGSTSRRSRRAATAAGPPAAPAPKRRATARVARRPTARRRAPARRRPSPRCRAPAPSCV
jgi:hypothetical protein